MDSLDAAAVALPIPQEDLDVWGGGLEARRNPEPSTTGLNQKGDGAGVDEEDETFEDDDDEEEEEEEEEVCAAAEEAGLNVKASDVDEDYVESENEEAAAEDEEENAVFAQSGDGESDDEEESEGAADGEGVDPEPEASAAPAAVPSEAEPAVADAPQTQSRRPTRNANKAPVDYKALLDGPVITKKIVRQRKQPYNEKGERVYCICRTIDNGKFMIQCDSCKDWYHGTCVSITERAARDITSYECEECIAVRKENEALAAIRRQEASEAARARREKAEADARKESALKAAKAAQSAQTSKAPPPENATFWSHGRQVSHPPAVKRPSLTLSLERKGSVSSIPSLPSTPGALDTHTPTSDGKADKIRMAVRKAFSDTFAAILADPELQPALAKSDIERIDPVAFADSVEDELFLFLSDGVEGRKRTCGDKYKGKFRTLQFNLKDKKNRSLRKKIATGGVTAEALVRFEAEDLANEDIKAKAEAIRLEGIRNAIKPKDVTSASIFKKTHKGEEEISVSGPSIAPVTSKESEARPSEIYAAPATGVLARLAEKVRSPSPPPGEKPFHSLDELLAKMGGGTTGPAKRSPDLSESHDDHDSKRTRLDDAAPFEPDVPMHDFDATSAVVRDPVDFTSWEDAVGDGFTVGDDSHSPTYSPSRSPPAMDFMGEEARPAQIWNGIVRMASVGMFNGRCRQIAGREVGTTKVWEDILPPTVTVEGRIDTKAARNYVGQQRQSSTKEVVAVEFYADDQVSSDLAVKAKEGFKTLFDYFYEKKRYAVVGQNYISVKDMYLVPIKAGEPLPEMITVLKKCAVGFESRPHDSIFGVIILDKSFFSKSVSKSDSRSSSSKRSARPSQEPRKKHASDSYTKTAPVPPPPTLPAMPTFPTLPLAASMPFTPAITAAPTANILASLAALSNLPASNLQTPQTSVSAILAQLQQPQQPIQQPLLGSAQVSNIQNILAQLQNTNPSLLMNAANAFQNPGSGRYGQR
ncbi:PHD finger protein 3 [Dinochytrium kinnereticum]|nr:PHD finger protein 3 [Dinochytrium kinnereticum]